MDPIWRLAFAVWGLALSAVYAATFVHEVVGHGLVARLGGGTFEGFKVGFWGSEAYCAAAPGSRLTELCVMAGGIVATGLLSGAFLDRERNAEARPEPERRLFHLVFGCFFALATLDSLALGLVSPTADKSDATHLLAFFGDPRGFREGILLVGTAGLFLVSLRLLEGLLEVAIRHAPPGALAEPRARFRALQLLIGLPLALSILAAAPTIGGYRHLDWPIAAGCLALLEGVLWYVASRRPAPHPDLMIAPRFMTQACVAGALAVVLALAVTGPGIRWGAAAAGR